MSGEHRDKRTDELDHEESYTIADLEEDLGVEFSHWTDVIRLMEGDEKADKVLEQVKEKGDIDELIEQNGGEEDGA